MRITYDLQKDLYNRNKHGISLAEAENIEWSTLFERLDQALPYGEDRFIGIAYLGLTLYCVIYTDRVDTRRIISLRKATNHEVDLYASS